jgi:predicted DNA binding protein
MSSPEVVNLTDQERAAVASALKPVAEIMRNIGWGTRLQDLTEEQVTALIAAAVGGFQVAMHATASGGEPEISLDARS